ncbi:GNAT family N-acetyltransferase [Lacrimispora sp. NSJ-141]|uniref:GNAT family N-acetyltransferase n=1 Tax=Lientehia hominis TaxID=2897778 RepID=A0AAP2W9Q7_9FIRM|nr:GNAT family N-acetyltransferase [Lientehia hominis]MCD2493586.1 GNAT family N-acetyltransferase [Lientehia hominis]
MVPIERDNIDSILPLFDGWNETMIWSCLQGYMGEAWADSAESPRSARIIVGDFCCLAGIPCPELIPSLSENLSHYPALLIPQGPPWETCIEQTCGTSVSKFQRYSIKKEPGIFDRDRLRSYVNTVPDGYRLSMIDEPLYHMAREEEWSRDLCSNFSSYQQYQSMGIGAAALYKGRLVSGASSYSVYRGGIEIEVDTKKEHRNKGLACACASLLILRCMERNLYPSWDAHDLRSVSLAEKLGYHRDTAYTAYLFKPDK